MLIQQKKTLAALRRILVFLDTHDDILGAVNAGGARRALNIVTQVLEELAPQQDPTRFQRASELQAERGARVELREKHMRRIARIAQLELDAVPEFDRLRLPYKKVDSNSLVVWAREMAAAAEPHEATFVDNGLAADFISNLLAAADAVQRAIDARSKAQTNRVGATALIHSETRRAMRVIGVIDALVAPELAHDDQLARDWLATRLVARRRTATGTSEVTATSETRRLTILPPSAEAAA